MKTPDRVQGSNLDEQDAAIFSNLVDEIETKLSRNEEVDIDSYVLRNPRLGDRLRSAHQTLVGLHDMLATQVDALDTTPVNRTLGDFRLIREIGRGGMGVVFEAEQISLDRLVAVKVLPLANLLDSRQLQRFKNEVRAAAMLKHPNIVSVHFVGCERGVHFYAMELVVGESLAQVIAAERTPSAPAETSESVVRTESETTPVASISTASQTEEPSVCRRVARLGVIVAEALAYSHEMGVIHRDIKPSNLLIDVDGKVQIADFGLARIQDRDDLTMSGDVIGTLRYMSPEQLEHGHVVDHRSDIYSLGLTLYELIEGKPAFVSDNRHELTNAILAKPPSFSSEMRRRLPVDLTTIIRKAIEKEITDRYANAQELADDLRRFLESKPIKARRTSWLGRTRRWVRRNRPFAAALSIVMLLLTAFSISGFVAARQQRSLADSLTEQLYAAVVTNSFRNIEDREFASAVEMMAPWAHDRYRNLKSVEWHYLKNRANSYMGAQKLNRVFDLYGLAYDPYRDRLAFTDWRGSIEVVNSDLTKRLWRVRAIGGEPVGAHSHYVPSVTFADDGKSIVTASGDKTIQFWDASTGVNLGRIGPLDEAPFCVAVHDASRTIAVGFRRDPIVDDNQTTIEIYHWHPDRIQQVRKSGEIDVGAHDAWDIDISPSGKFIAAACRGASSPQVWRADSLEAVAMMPSFDASIKAVAFSPQDDHVLAVATGNEVDERIGGRIELVEIGKDTTSSTLGECPIGFRCVCFSPNGKYIAAGAYDGSVLLVGRNGESQPRRIHEHSSIIRGIAFDRASSTLFTASQDTCLRRWKLDEFPTTLAARQAGTTYAIEAQRELVASGHQDGMLRLWNRRQSKLIGKVHLGIRYVTGVGLTRDQQFVAGSGGEFPAGLNNTPGAIKVFRTDDLSKAVWEKTIPNVIVWAIAFSPSGHLLAATVGNDILLIDIDSGRQIGNLIGHGGTVRQLAFSSDGTLLASASMEGNENCLIVWDVLSRTEHRVIDSNGSLMSVAVCAEADLVAAAARNEIQIFRLSDGQMIKELTRHSKHIFALDFNADGRRLLSAGWNGQMKLWNVDTGSCLLTRSYEDKLFSAGFTPSDESIFVGELDSNYDGLIHFLDCNDRKPLFTENRKMQP